MTKAILFDSWGTLVETGVFPSPVKQVRYILRIHEPFGEYITRFEQTFMTCDFESLKEGFEAVSKEFGIPVRDFVIERLIGMWNKNMLLAKPFPDTLEVLEDLKKDYKLALVSNTDSFSIGNVLDKYDLRRFFDVVALSCDVGKLKTDPAMFDHVLKKLKVKKEDAIMVGDSMQSDVMGAEKAGIKAVLLDRRGTRDYENKITDLTEVRSIAEQ